MPSVSHPSSFFQSEGCPTHYPSRTTARVDSEALAFDASHADHDSINHSMSLDFGDDAANADLSILEIAARTHFPTARTLDVRRIQGRCNGEFKVVWFATVEFDGRYLSAMKSDPDATLADLLRQRAMIVSAVAVA